MFTRFLRWFFADHERPTAAKKAALDAALDDANASRIDFADGLPAHGAYGAIARGARIGNR